MQSSIIFSLLALASTGFTSPVAEALVAASQASGSIIPASVAIAYGGAVAPTTTPRPVVDVGAGPEYLTITIINSHGDAISTAHARASGAPSPVGGPIGPGLMTKGQTASFAVPTGWAGNVAIADGSYTITGDDSLIEANYDIPSGYSYAVADVDVSYVNGFSVAITCSCSDTHVTGCNKNLFALGTCGDNDGEDACVNPERACTSCTSASSFFAPCQGLAYTYPNDNGANSFGQCQSGHITCCVGSACPNAQ